MGAWIEIFNEACILSNLMSLLSWERGLKYHEPGSFLNYNYVAPLVGAWIEIVIGQLNIVDILVAPLVGAWIEISSNTHGSTCVLGRSSRGSVD